MVAFPLAPFLMRAGITALGAGAAGEGIKSLQNINPDVAEQAFLRTIIGPISDIFNRTTDTPSGKSICTNGRSNRTKSNTRNSSTRTTTRNYRITYTRTATRNYRITYTRKSTWSSWFN
jgi:hypothetical protein